MGRDAVPARGGSSLPHSGGFGAPPGRHYDRSARSSLCWDQRTVRPVPKFQEARPGAEPRGKSLGESRGGAPRGERAPLGALRTPLRADHGWMRLSALRLPSSFVRGSEGFLLLFCKAPAQLRREDDAACSSLRATRSNPVGGAVLDCFVAGPVIGRPLRAG